MTMQNQHNNTCLSSGIRRSRAERVRMRMERKKGAFFPSVKRWMSNRWVYMFVHE